MKVHWDYEGCGKQDQERLRESWQRLRPALEARVAGLPDEPAELELAVYHQEVSPNWQIQAALHLPARTLVGEAARDTPEEAVDDVLSGLGEKIDAVLEQPAEATQRREGLEGIVPFLQRSHQSGRSDAFFSFLAPVVASLGSHVRRELQILEIEAGLGAGEITPADVLDEVLLRAYQRFRRRPADLALDLWLVRLANEVLEEARQSVVEGSLDEQVPKPSTENRESYRDSWTEWATFSETVELGDLLPGLPAADAWDSLDVETKQTNMASLLAELPRPQRQALLLHAVQGFSTAEIADFQHRAEPDVHTDIEAARRTIWEHLDERRWLELEEELTPHKRGTSGKRSPR